jgi:hypothetical protein
LSRGPRQLSIAPINPIAKSFEQMLVAPPTLKDLHPQRQVNLCADQTFDVFPRMCADALEQRPTIANYNAFLRFALDVNGRADVGQRRRPLFEFIKTTATEWGTSCCVLSNTFSRIISAAISRKAVSLN